MSPLTPKRNTIVFAFVVALSCIGLSTAVLGRQAATATKAPSQPVPTSNPQAVLALDLNGHPAPVTETRRVPVSDGGVIITGEGTYDVVFTNAVAYPGFSAPISVLRVTVDKVQGKWVHGQYKLSNGSQGGAWINTEQLLSINRMP
jgi:hypothetical protein